MLILSIVGLCLPGSFAQSPSHENSGDLGSFALFQNAINTKVRTAVDLGPVARNTNLSQITLVFRRSAYQHSALDRLLKEQQDPSSPNYHRSLTPEEFGRTFGADTATIERTKSWLQSAGFSVKTLARGRGWIIFSGNAGQVQDAFRTQIHRYSIGGKTHFATNSVPAVPSDLAPFVASIRGLDDFHPQPQIRVRPMYTAPDGSHALAPGDVTTIYALNSLAYSGGGSGQTIAVVGQSDIDTSDIQLFRSTFQLPANDPQLVLAGDDPGVDQSALLEADADLEWAGALAPMATLLYADSTDVFDSAQYVIDQNSAQILVFSYGVCEPNMSLADASAIQDLAQQGNAEGITWIAASGDAGAAGCDQGSAAATQGLAVWFPASLPEVTAVGGTEFNEGQNGWGTGDNPNLSSVLGYLPEIGWNDTSSAQALAAGGGGASILFSQPPWQNVPGVPANNARNVPDIALDASPVHDPYIVIIGGQTYAAGGTSLATPVFAGIMALSANDLAYQSGISAGLGNINASLYSLSQISAANAIHDITTGSNIVPCTAGTPDCADGVLGYNASPGYDLVTGLGSINGSNFVDWFRLATVTTLSASASQVQQGVAVTFTATVSTYSGNIPLGGGLAIVDTSSNLPLQGTYVNGPGSSAVSVTLSPGPHSIVAGYTNGASTTTSPGARFMSSTSAPVSVMVVPSAPQAPVLMSPQNRATNISVTTVLNWNPVPGYATYDVYFGTISPPPFWGNVAGTQCSPSGLVPGTTYYWMVIASNMSGSATSTISSFTTSGQTVYTLSLIAGTGQQGFSGDGGPALNAQFNEASDVVLDASGNLFVADSGNHRVREITPDGLITTVAGNGAIQDSGDGGLATAAGTDVTDVAIDGAGDLYISSAFRVRKVSPDGTISTFAGNGTEGHGGDGGPATEAQLNEPSGLAVDSAGNVYIVDTNNNCIREVSAGIISTLAGQCGSYSGMIPGNGVPATSANLFLNQASGIAVDIAANVYFAWGGSVGEITNGVINLFAAFAYTAGPAEWVAVDRAGNLYYVTLHNLIEVANGSPTTIAGGGTLNFAPGLPGTSVNFAASGFVVSSGGTIYLAANDQIWALSPSNSASLTFFPNGVANAAGLTPGSVTPGSIATLYGTFSLNTPATSATTPLPTTLSGLSIRVGSSSALDAPLYYVSDGVVNIQVPWELSGQSSATIQAILNDVSGGSQTLQLVPFSPGIFTVGGNQGAIVDLLGRLVDTDNPVMAGSVITIYCSGLGAVSNQPATGNPASTTSLSPTTTTPYVTIGGVQAPVLFSGLAPGSVGEYQVNVQVPTGTGIGAAVPVVLSIGGATSNVVTVAVR